MRKCNEREQTRDWINEDDAPELTDDFFERADEYQGQVLIRRGNSSKMAVKLNLERILSPPLKPAVKIGKIK